MKNGFRLAAAAIIGLVVSAPAADLSFTDAPAENDFILSGHQIEAGIYVEASVDRAVRRAAEDLSADFARVTGSKPALERQFPPGQAPRIIIGTIGSSAVIDRLAAEGKLATNGVSGQWESFVLQVVKQPLPGCERALVIAGSDRRGTIYGLYQLSEWIGVSPWYWWADVPVAQRKILALHGDTLKQGPPAVKFRGIFLNDEDWGMRPWAATTLEPETGNIGPKTYAKVFELLLRLRANYLWPAMHLDTRAFNFYPTNKFLADEYGIVMGSSHCEQMLRDNVDEWDTNRFGEYNYVTNPEGVRKYWEERVRENGVFDNVFTLGMRGVHDSGMPGGGTEREKAQRLHTIIAAQREMLARLVRSKLASVPQIFCPYKEVLPLYRLMPDIPADITLVWPDDNYGYIRQFSDARERARSGGAGVYYHVSYWGRPRDYLWLCSTPPALIAEEMTKAYAFGADQVWVLNVGDLKPAELDTEFFLRLAWNPRSWNGTNTYDLLSRQLARDFGAAQAEELTAILAEYYRLNFQRKPEHIGFPNNHLFTPAEARQRLAAWRQLLALVEAVEAEMPAASRDAFFELIGYPVKAAAAINEEYLAGSPAAAVEIHRLTEIYNQQIAAGKWRNMMSDNPRGQVNLKLATNAPVAHPAEAAEDVSSAETKATAGADFQEVNQRVVMEAEHASKRVPGAEADWKPITGLGYNGEAIAIFPVTASGRDQPETILGGSPCLQFNLVLQTGGDWQFTVRALPTFSVAAGQPQRYAIAVDDERPQIISLPAATSEQDRVWQENVLRNAALTTSLHHIAQPGRHTLKIWMVDPGIVLDTIAGATGHPGGLGYVWPPETRGAQ